MAFTRGRPKPRSGWSGEYIILRRIIRERNDHGTLACAEMPEQSCTIGHYIHVTVPNILTVGKEQQLPSVIRNTRAPFISAQRTGHCRRRRGAHIEPSTKPEEPLAVLRLRDNAIRQEQKQERNDPHTTRTRRRWEVLPTTTAPTAHSKAPHRRCSGNMRTGIYSFTNRFRIIVPACVTSTM